MSSISSSSAYSVSASNNGISGLASGMDTDSMVEKMLSGTQNKIDKQLALQQQWTWKQEMYQDVTAAINSFKSKYIDTAFDSTLANNLASADFFNSMSSSVAGGSSEYLKIISSSPEASVGDMNIIVKQLASTAKLSPSAGHEKLSKNKISGKIDASKIAENFQKKEVTLKVGSKEVNVNLSGLSASTEILERLNEALKSSGADASAKMLNGRISITSGSKSTRIEVDGEKSTEWGLQVLGFSKDAVSSETDANAQALTGGSSPNATAGVSFDINLNGVNKTISIDPEATGTDEDGNPAITQEDVQRALGNAIARAFGGTVQQTTVAGDNAGDPNKANIGDVTGGYINVKFGDDGSIEISADNQFDQITITGVNANTLGITPGSTNRVTTATKLSDLSDDILGGSYKFTINGVDFSFTGDDTLGTMINKINSSTAGVKLSYSSLSDSLSLETNSSGSRFGIKISQQEGNLLSALFGNDVVAAGTSVSSNRLTKGSIEGSYDFDRDATMTDPSFTIKVNGESHTFSLDGEYNVDAAIEEINKQLAEKFQLNDGSAAIQITKDNDNETLDLSIKSDEDNHFYVTIDQSSVNVTNSDAVAAAKKTDLAFVLGFNTTSKNNAADETTKIDDLSISDAQKAALKTLLDAGVNQADATIQDILSNNDALKFENGRFVAGAAYTDENGNLVDGVALVDGNSALQELFGISASDPNKDSLSDLIGTGQMTGTVVQGTDALVSVNGIDITRNSNTFTIDGITMQLTKAMQPDNPNMDSGLQTDSKGNLYDANGNRINANGYVVDKYGNQLKELTGPNGTAHYVVNSDGRFVSSKGNLLDGSTINSSGKAMVVDIAGNPTGIWEPLIPGQPATIADAGLPAGETTLKPVTATYNNVSPITITTERNVDTIVETLKNFVTDYNAMLDKLNGYVYADATYRDYDPLTSEQKKEMSDREIELWEEKAQEGLLRNDSDISYFLSQMRIALYTKPSSSNFALYDIGIDTGSYSDRGKLTFDETTLRKALADDPESVKNLFTDATSGLARQMANIMDQTAKISTASPGTLVQTAGAKGTKIKSSDNDIYNRLKEIKDKIKDLQSKYETERERYWKMFTNMETNLSNLNTQSSWLYQQFSTTG